MSKPTADQPRWPASPRRLRDPEIQELIVKGDPFWRALAIDVVTSKDRWHQSGRIRINALRALRRRLCCEDMSAAEQSELHDAIDLGILQMLDSGVGEEFRALANVARTAATPKLIAALEDRVRTSPSRPHRINAQRLLDRIAGKPYRPYGS